MLEPDKIVDSLCNFSSLIGVLYEYLVLGILENHGVRKNIGVLLDGVSLATERLVRRNTNALGIVDERVSANTRRRLICRAEATVNNYELAARLNRILALMVPPPK